MRLAFLMLVGSVLTSSVFAAGRGELTPEQARQCAELERTGFRRYREVPAATFAPKASETAKYQYEIPLAIHVYNHKRAKGLAGIFSNDISEGELAFHLEQARRVYHQCGVEVVVDSVDFDEGPEFLDRAERTTRAEALSDQERCLFKPLNRSGLLNVYFVSEAPSQGEQTAHAINDGALSLGEYSRSGPEDAFIRGTIVITDESRLGSARRRDYVLPHEIGHVVMNSNHVDRYNLMADTAENLSPGLTKEQCEKVVHYGFARPRSGQSTVTTAVECATRGLTLLGTQGAPGTPRCE